MTNITPVLQAVLVLLFSIVTVFLIPWLKSNLDNNKLDKLLTIVKAAVEAAEQIYRETGMGAQKKAYVINYLAEHGYKLDASQLDVMIESAVKEMKIALEV